MSDERITALEERMDRLDAQCRHIAALLFLIADHFDPTSAADVERWLEEPEAPEGE